MMGSTFLETLFRLPSIYVQYLSNLSLGLRFFHSSLLWGLRMKGIPFGHCLRPQEQRYYCKLLQVFPIRSYRDNDCPLFMDIQEFFFITPAASRAGHFLVLCRLVQSCAYVDTWSSKKGPLICLPERLSGIACPNICVTTQVLLFHLKLFLVDSIFCDSEKLIPSLLWRLLSDGKSNSSINLRNIYIYIYPYCTYMRSICWFL